MSPVDSANPFRTSRTRPGEIDFVFRAGESWSTLRERFQGSGQRGQIVGPHGSGKTTLLLQFAAYLNGQGQRTRVLRLSSRVRLDLAQLGRDAELVASTVLAVDAYEQLTLGARARLARLAARRELGLVVTTHREAWLPVLYRTALDPRIAREIVQGLLAPVDSVPRPGFDQFQDESLLGELISRHGANMREILFELFDRWRQ